MLFNSHLFMFVFLPLLLAGWFLLNRIRQEKLAQGYLIGMSLWFYAHFSLTHLWIMLGSCLAGYLFCLLVSHSSSQRRRKWALAAGCLFHLGTLGYFKYSNFFLENVNGLFGTDFSLAGLILPVGISFYTFQQLAYLIDVYRGEAQLCTALDYLTFQVYFPQILQGPILLQEEFLPKLHDPACRRFDGARFSQGLIRFTIGLSKKVLLADLLAKAINFGYENTALLDSVSALVLAAGYMVELYFDFSGYCDMAVGLGKMVGLEVAENFDAPFRSSSVKEFWRRWHSTLGRFFTRYVYIPLGGSRCKKSKAMRNTLIVFLLSGLWHGSSWNFVFWGLLHGIAVVWDGFGLLRLPKKWMNQALTFLYVSLAFVFFRAESFAQAFAVLRAIAVPRWNGFLFRMAEALDISETYILTKAVSMAAPELLSYVCLALFLLLAAICAAVLAGRRARELAADALTARRALWYAFLLAWSVISMTGVGTYIYFSF